jgi:DNA (cytosine-5)-methyltransferase 1
MLRVIHEIRPRYVVAENVRGAVNLALDTVQAGMEDEGYKVWAFVLPAAAFGAPHQRERLFVVGVREDVANAYATRLQRNIC